MSKKQTIIVKSPEDDADEQIEGEDEPEVETETSVEADPTEPAHEAPADEPEEETKPAGTTIGGPWG